MGPSLQPSISIAEVLPQNVNNNTPESAGASPTRPGFTRSQSTLVGQYIDEKTPKGSIEVGSPAESCQESKPQGETPETGKLASWKGALILLVTGGAMFMDNVFMTSTNISLAAIQEEFGVQSSDLQWMISAYTLSFGGFLLLSGVMSDRFGRKPMLLVGLIWLSIWTLTIGFGSSFIEIAVFRGLQGMGAALTIPSAVGIISSYFTGQDRTRALGLYAASGAVGFTGGLVLGGLLSSSLGWRYIFRLSVIVSTLLGVLGYIVLPTSGAKIYPNSRMDYFGATLSTSGLILLAFVVSGGGVYGWGSPFIIVLLVLAIALLVAFVVWESKVSNPIMPLSLWKIHNFPSLWIVGFTANGSFSATLYYTVLMAQQVDNLSPLETAIRFIPSGVLGFVITLMTTRAIESFDGKHILITALVISVLAPIPSCLLTAQSSNFWVNVLPTIFISVTAISIGYISASTFMLLSAPMHVKSLCGGMINTAYQIGGGVSLAICSAVVQAVDIDKGHDVAQQYTTGLWCTAGISGVGLIVAVFFLKSDRSVFTRGEENIDVQTEILKNDINMA
ncbi:uncharacterized protein TRUGW13939_03420 [Talaromyces rugulosus]|uniref:Major facilitator superfamily (MFS) profile domain-containing protein n=1 Tax=Talaromyces rugulosus TaxID=121627 RepID=A0A7H8QR20_TALRU|nr:uncharacterized protein TRUGW13939_03420 [Talaromyces rugulosus]QKX56319.1 hypothetical protein TRUGW13939_03420 [Talaromyces rugulosus]